MRRRGIGRVAPDGKIALSRGVVQLSGDIMVCPASALRGAALQSHTLLSMLLRHEQTPQQSTACMANHTIESRLCRWLLRARDLAHSDTLLFTQEYLADMLGVRRTSVTTVARRCNRRA
jgi:CRP-like cAMP-binding protein